MADRLVYEQLFKNTVQKILTIIKNREIPTSQLVETDDLKVLTADERIKIEKIAIDGEGDKYLSNDGTYKTISGGSLSEDDAEKVNKIITDGDGNKYLSDDGTYKEINVNLDNADLSISTETGNIVEKKTDGLYATVAISADETNVLSAKSDGLYVPDIVISTADNNALVEQSDGSLYVEDTLISAEDKNAIVEKEDGWYVEDKTEDIAKLREDLDPIKKYQRYVNTDMDYFSATGIPVSNEDTVILTTTPVNYIFDKMNIDTNMDIVDNTYITLKAGKRYKINVNCVVNGNVGVLYIQTQDGEKLAQSYFNTVNTYSSTEISYICCLDKDTNITITSNVSFYITPSYSYITIHEVAQKITIDPVEHIDTTQGLQDTPVGHIIAHMGNKAPKHYLICDGAEYNILDYPYLAEHIKEEFGSYNYFGGDGEVTFAVPKNIKDLENDNTYGLIPQMSGYSNDTCIITHDSEHTSNDNSWKSFYVFDRNDTTAWFSEKKPSSGLEAYVQVKFIDNIYRKVEVVSLRNFLYNGNNRCKDFEIQASENGINFDTLLTNVLPNDDTKYYNYPITYNKPYNIFRIVVKSNYATADNYNYGLGDVRLFGTIVSECPCIKYEPTYYMNIYGIRTEKVLFEGEANAVGTYELADSVKNYDEFVVYGKQTNGRQYSRDVHSPSEIYTAYDDVNNFCITNPSVTMYIDYSFVNETTFRIDNVKTYNGIQCIIYKVVGIKYGTTTEGAPPSGSSCSCPTYTDEEVNTAIDEILISNEEGGTE